MYTVIMRTEAISQRLMGQFYASPALEQQLYQQETQDTYTNKSSVCPKTCFLDTPYHPYEHARLST